MMNGHRWSWIIPLVVGVFVLALAGCHEKPTEPELTRPLSVALIGGPAEGSTIPNGAYITFQWSTVGGKGNVGYQYQLAPLESSPVSTTDQQVTYRDLQTGDYTFTLKAIEGTTESDPKIRSFKVGASTAPTVSIQGARAHPIYAPEGAVFFSWSSTDTDLFGEIAGFRWANVDTTTWSPWALTTSASVTAPADPGTYTFYVQAKDNAGTIGQASFNYTVKEPTIFLVDETSDDIGHHGDEAPFGTVEEYNHDLFYKTMLDGFSYMEWDIEEKGYPKTADVPAGITTMIWVGSDPFHGSWGWDVGWAYTYYVVVKDTLVPNVLTEFIDNGGKFWLMGENWLEEISIHGPVQIDDGGLEDVYLHLQPDTTLSQLDFNSANPASGFEVLPVLTVDINKSSSSIVPESDDLVPRTDAEIIYRTLDLSGADVGASGIRWPAGAAPGQTLGVVLSFDPYYTALTKARQLALIVLEEWFGE